MASAVVRALFAAVLCSASVSGTSFLSTTTSTTSTLAAHGLRLNPDPRAQNPGTTSTMWSSRTTLTSTAGTMETSAVSLPSTTQMSTTTLSRAETNVPAWASTKLLGWTADPMGIADAEICAALILCVSHRDVISDEACADVDTVRHTVFFVHASKILDVCIDSCDVIVALWCLVTFLIAKRKRALGFRFDLVLRFVGGWGIALGFVATMWVPVAIKLALGSGLEALGRLVDAECFPIGFGHNALVYQYDTASGMSPVLVAQICLGILGVVIQVMQQLDINEDEEVRGAGRRVVLTALIYVLVAASELAVDSTDLRFNYRPLYDNLNEIFETLFQQQGVFQDGTSSIVHYVGADPMSVQWELSAAWSPAWWFGLIIPCIIAGCLSCSCCCGLSCAFSCIRLD